MKCHMYLDTVILIVPRQPMYARGPLMLDEEHSMVVLQLVIHLFLNQACFILYFENRMTEGLLFAKNEKQSPFCIKGALLLISKNDFHSYRNCKQRHLLTSFWQLEQMDVWIQKKSSFFNTLGGYFAYLY